MLPRSFPQTAIADFWRRPLPAVRLVPVSADCLRGAGADRQIVWRQPLLSDRKSVV